MIVGTLNLDQLAAYPLLHPVFLAEYVMEGKHITILAHGHHDVSVSSVSQNSLLPHVLLHSTFLCGVIHLTQTNG